MEKFDTSTIKIASHAAYRRACRVMLGLVREQQASGRQDKKIAELCQSPEALCDYAVTNTLALLKTGVEVRPTYVLMSKAGDGVVIPMVMEVMPEHDKDRLNVIGPLALILRSAPIDAYFFISEMWVNREHRPDEERIKLVVIMAFVGAHASKTRSFTVVRHPETNEVMGLRPFDAVVTMDQSNPCLLNLYELADNIILSLMDGIEGCNSGKGNTPPAPH